MQLTNVRDDAHLACAPASLLFFAAFFAASAFLASAALHMADLRCALMAQAARIFEPQSSHVMGGR